MDKVLYIVKWVSIVQVALIIIFLALLYLTRIFITIIEKRNRKNKEQIFAELNNYLNNSTPIAASPKVINRLKSSIDIVLSFLNELERYPNNEAYIDQFIADLSQKVLKPTARKLVRSRRWYKRYNGTLCFAYGFDDSDIPTMQRLIQDDVLLVSVNASKIAAKYNNSLLINTLITTFSKGRRLQQSVYADLISNGNVNIAPVIEKRLETENDLYVKIYCYHLLFQLPPQDKMIPEVQDDIKINAKDLKIAILNYISRIENEEKNPILYAATQDSEWEVKAVAARLLGAVHSDDSLRLLEQMLDDLQWWVRINAAQSLSKQGPRGIAILESQSPERNKFAYDTAVKVLTQSEVYERKRIKTKE